MDLEPIDPPVVAPVVALMEPDHPAVAPIAPPAAPVGEPNVDLMDVDEPVDEPVVESVVEAAVAPVVEPVVEDASAWKVSAQTRDKSTRKNQRRVCDEIGADDNDDDVYSHCSDSSPESATVNKTTPACTRQQVARGLVPAPPCLYNRPSRQTQQYRPIPSDDDVSLASSVRTHLLFRRPPLSQENVTPAPARSCRRRRAQATTPSEKARKKAKLAHVQNV